MKSNFWVESNFNDEIKNFHELKVKEMNLPSWAKINCPDCDKKIPCNGIRGIALRFNAVNLGDLAVEYHCDECQLMDTVYYRKDICNISEFIACLKFQEETKEKPIIEEEIHKKRYNNLTNKLLGDMNHEHDQTRK